MKQHSKLVDLVEPVISGLGFIFVGLELASAANSTIIRIYVDKTDSGLNVDDCSKISRQINAVLSVEWQGNKDYSLEVSSPGIDRKLFTLEQFVPYIGKLVKVKLIEPLEDGRRNLKGRLNLVENGQINIDVDSIDYTISYDNVDMAKVVPEW